MKHFTQMNRLSHDERAIVARFVSAYDLRSLREGSVHLCDAVDEVVDRLKVKDGIPIEIFGRLVARFGRRLTTLGFDSNYEGGLAAQLQLLDEGCPALTGLYFGDGQILDGIDVDQYSLFKRLRHLSVSTNDPRHLASLVPGLRSLSVDVICRHHRLEALTSLSGLTMLDFHVTGGLTSIGPLSSLTDLKSLSINWARHVADLSPLSGLTGLTDLDMTVMDDVRTHAPLEGLTGLRRLALDVRGDAGEVVAKLPRLSGLRAIGIHTKHMFLVECRALEDLEAQDSYLDVRELPASLKRLSVFNRLSVFKRLPRNMPEIDSRLPSLICLQTVGVTWTRAALAAVARLPKLEALSIRECDAHSDKINVDILAELAPVLPALRFLDISHTKIDDIARLAAASRLEKLDICGTPVDTVCPLISLGSLNTIVLSACTAYDGVGLLPPWVADPDARNGGIAAVFEGWVLRPAGWAGFAATV